MAGGVPPLRFSPIPRVSDVPIGGGQACLVFDDVLADPQAWIEFGAARRDAFAESPDNAYPGPELQLPAATVAALDGFFAQHARRALGGRRTLRATARLAIATRQPEDLAPRQWLCHVDRMQAVPGEAIAASVLYLFADPALGGTAFFRPRRPLADVASLVQDSATLSPAGFRIRSGLPRGYMTTSNPWFERVAAVPARFNRLIFYPGSVFHSADITAPERLDPDPRRGRLTLNGFFVCRRGAGAASPSGASGPA
jgi:hypothetical protein